MRYKEIECYDIKNNPNKVNVTLTNNANYFNNDLYILSCGNHFNFDDYTIGALKSLKERIEQVLDNQLNLCYNLIKIKKGIDTHEERKN